MVALSRFFSRFSWDVVGFSASVICAIHCVAVPVLLMISSISGLQALHSHTIENFILAFSAAMGSISIIPGWRKHHRKTAPVFLFGCGLTMIIISRLDLALLTETVFTTAGAILIATSHWMNWRLCRPFHLQAQSKSI
jgi:hypothetical protein